MNQKRLCYLPPVRNLALALAAWIAVGFFVWLLAKAPKQN
jgi:hypothetical protein